MMLFAKQSTWSSFVAILNCLSPRSKSFSPAQMSEARTLIETILAQQSSLVLMKIRLFLRLINWLAILKYQRHFGSLNLDQQNKIMSWLFDNPVKIIRIGFWGINTLAKLAVYGQESVYPELHYEQRRIQS